MSSTLISNRRDELGLRPAEVVRRCGYKNIPKGLRRLESVTQGRFKGNDALIQALASALEILLLPVARLGPRYLWLEYY